MLSVTVKLETVRMDVSNRTVTSEAMQTEWQEILAAKRSPALFRPLYERYFEVIFRFILIITIFE